MFTTTRFDSWDLPDEIQSSLKAIGWEFATQVQRDTIPLARNGTDVIGQARTGSGKTAAFGLPILERCQATGCSKPSCWRQPVNLPTKLLRN